jgi:capsular polysaccharide biosynthesis protein
MGADDTIKDRKSLAFKALAVRKELIFGPRDVSLPNVCVYNNVGEYDQTFARHLEQDVYAARTAVIDAVELVTLPPDTVVHGDLNFLTTFEDVFIEEQYLPNWDREATPHRLALDSTTPVINVNEPCLLVARFGEGTWGHWLGELLPRAVAAENMAPGKYSFAVPSDTTDPSSNYAMARNVLASLRAYGIEEHRLLRLDKNHRYKFENLHAVTSVWAHPYAVHPGAINLMRHSLKVRIPKIANPAHSAAMLRIHGTGRDIENLPEILDFLKIKGYDAFDVGQMPFIEQVSLFQQASATFGVLGSNLTGLIYSPYGVKSVTVAPGAWGDRFFMPSCKRITAFMPT